MRDFSVTPNAEHWANSGVEGKAAYLEAHRFTVSLLRRIADGVADDTEHFVLIDWFLKEGDGASGHGFFPELGRFHAGDENNGRLADFIDATEPVENQKAIPCESTCAGHIRLKIDVENDEVGTLAANATDRGGTIHGGADFVANGFQFDGHRFENDDIVICDEDLRYVRADGFAGGFWRQGQ
jgi:hypothetical protein